MAQAVVSIALQTLQDLNLEEARFLSGLSSEVKGLETQLKEIQCLLEDADKRQHEGKTVRHWIAEIRDLARRAEDAIETYAFHAPTERRRGLKRLLRKFSHGPNEDVSLHQIGAEISKIKSEIARVTKNMLEYGIIRSATQGESSAANSNENLKWKRKTFPIEIEDCFVGNEEGLKRLVSLVIDDEKEQRIVSVWGMGGIGKTTIARKVYHHIEIKRSYEAFAWVCITQQCQFRSALEEILKQLIPQKTGNLSTLSDAELIGQVHQIQKAKRCLVVLDDLWEIDHWKGLKHGLLVERSKSKILLTTRKRDVADIGFPFELGLLNINDGWELLKKKAFPKNDIQDSGVRENAFQTIGEKMVRKCGCLPLVICLLGGVLSEKKSITEWEIVNENISAYLYGGEGIEKKNEINGVLNLSYEDLPYYLKPCFLYMGLFREDESIDVKILYRSWVAQGMILHENQGTHETLMDVADLYLSELASRCIVQVEAADNTEVLKYKFCQLHDVVREFCLSKGKEENFCFKSVDYQGGNFSTLLDESLLGRTCGLAFHFEGEVEVECYDRLMHIKQEDSTKHVRSLEFHNRVKVQMIELPHSIIDFRKFMLLRVLIFRRIYFPRRKLPRGIGNLIHLRYLRLRACEIDELPSSIGNLKYLHTLDLLKSSDVKVPNILKKLPRLKHLLLPEYTEAGFFKLKFEGLEELEELFGFNTAIHDLKTLTKINNLQRFAALVHDNKSLSAIVNDIIPKWKNLRKCTLVIQPYCDFTSSDEGLVILKKMLMCPSIHNLRINVQIGNLLAKCETEVTVSRLVDLWLNGSEIEDDPMEILGKLPCLKELSLDRCFVGEEMKCHAAGFPSLEYLELYGLPYLREWRVDQGAMPLLSEVQMFDCPCLEMLPDGFRFISTLQKLTISGMPELATRLFTSANGGEGGSQEVEKVRHVSSIIVSAMG